ncbi:SPARC-related modular calcium-binding protein 1 [Lontra canadensis]|uniref:SPARC-related modular calcium-binding protein 1 n=1 Tax=Lontra canadensis TaxID=76717 RepID=UPI0013F2E6BC|nr:SPARC-related modular calcium-binding protein 1 [Lontra canadensis]
MTGRSERSAAAPAAPPPGSREGPRGKEGRKAGAAVRPAESAPPARSRLPGPAGTMLPARCARLLTPHLLLVLVQLSLVRGHRTTGPRFLISDRDPQCNLHCSRTQPKPICASDGRSYESMCEYQRAKCRDPNLGVVHRGRCKDAGQSKCRLERAQALEQAKKPQEAVFVPECSEDGSFTQVQCHTYTGYCWCVTADGKPISGSSVQNKTPVCSGSVTDKPLSQGNSGRKGE